MGLYYGVEVKSPDRKKLTAQLMKEKKNENNTEQRRTTAES